MKDSFLIGIDIGTQSTRAALLDLDGRVIASSSSGLELSTPQPGWAEQDPQIWWETTISNIHQILAQADVPAQSLVAVGACGQMHGTVPIGCEGELLSRSVQLWCDKRSADLVNDFKAHPEAPSAYRIAGSPAAPSWFGFKIKWLKSFEPELYAKTWKFLVPKDYVNYCLTGVAATDYSEASGAFLMDAQHEIWSEKLVDLLDIDMNKLPDIYPSSGVIGKVTKEAAQQTGLREGMPVVAGGGDMLCTLLAAGITEVGRACDITGTASHLSVFADRPVLDDRLMNLHHAMPGWIPFGITDSGGGALKWFKDSFCQEETRKAEETRSHVYSLLDAEAAKVEPGCNGLLFFPYLLGERTLGTPFARGVFFGLTPGHGKGAVVRAIMEGVCFELRRPLEIIEAAGTHVEEVRTTGGGARSDLWSQLKADIYQKRVVTFENFEGGMLGAAILAGVGAGVYPDERSGADRTVRLAREFLPDTTLADRYDYLFDLFKELHDVMQAPFNKLPTLP